MGSTLRVILAPTAEIAYGHACFIDVYTVPQWVEWGWIAVPQDTELYKTWGVLEQSCVRALSCDPEDVASTKADVEAVANEATAFFGVMMQNTLREV